MPARSSATAASHQALPHSFDSHRNDYFTRLKERARRQRHVAAVLEWRKDRQRDRRFAAHLDRTVGIATRWRIASEPLATAREIVHRMRLVPEPPARKGSPSLIGIRAADLEALAQVLSSDAQLSAQALDAAARIASVEPESADAFLLYLAIFWLVNERTIAQLRLAATDCIALHMTCAARVARADRSIASFGVAALPSLTHLKLIGTGEDFRFAPSEMVLGVACRDSYECLPQKVFQGLAIITLACNPQCIVKLDDDHRLEDAIELERILRFAAKSHDALQLGEVNRTALPSAHHRAWHFGKCGSAAIGSRPLEMPTPLKWAAGSAGYVLNRAALWRVLWSSLYYAHWLDEIVYEDIALAEVATKTGIRIVEMQMKQAMGAVSEY